MDCPYCHKDVDYCDDEPRGEDVVEETQCPHCEKMFTFSRSYSIDYHTNQADCLNGSPHEFKKVTRVPMVVGGKIRWRCITGCSQEENRDSACPHGGPYCVECKE